MKLVVLVLLVVSACLAEQSEESIRIAVTPYLARMKYYVNDEFLYPEMSCDEVTYELQRDGDIDLIFYVVCRETPTLRMWVGGDDDYNILESVFNGIRTVLAELRASKPPYVFWYGFADIKILSREPVLGTSEYTTKYKKYKIDGKCCNALIEILRSNSSRVEARLKCIDYLRKNIEPYGE